MPPERGLCWSPGTPRRPPWRGPPPQPTAHPPKRLFLTYSLRVGCPQCSEEGGRLTEYPRLALAGVQLLFVD